MCQFNFDCAVALRYLMPRNSANSIAECATLRDSGHKLTRGEIKHEADRRPEVN